jgi:hypothetical protein
MTKQSDGVASAWSTVEEIQMSFLNVSCFLTALSFQLCVVQNSTVFPSILLELLICRIDLCGYHPGILVKGSDTTTSHLPFSSANRDMSSLLIATVRVAQGL